jgi:hypothetical protein
METETEGSGQRDAIDVRTTSVSDVGIDAHLEAAYEDRYELDEAS